MDLSLDPLTLARFMVLPGAPELVEAFSRIPAGPLRDSVISHAQVMASTYDEARTAGAPIPDPLTVAALHSPRSNGMAALPSPGEVAQALSGPRKGEVALDSKEARAVKMRMEGIGPEEIHKKLKMPLHAVTAAFKQARRAGIAFPVLAKGSTPVARKSFPIRMEDMDGRGMGAMRGAAERLGITLERYVELRAMLVKLRKANTPIEELVVALKPIPEKIIWDWIYRARAAGIELASRLDFDDAEFQAAPPPARRYFPPYDELDARARASVDRAAKARGISSVAYCELRESIIDKRMNGVSQTQIIIDTGESGTTVKDILAHAVHRWGLTFPSTPRYQKVA